TPSGAGGGPLTIALDYLNGDLRTDIVRANTTGNNVSVLRQLAAGGLSAPQTAIASASPRAVARAGCDGDPCPAGVGANFSQNTVSLLLNDGTGTLLMGTPQA